MELGQRSYYRYGSTMPPNHPVTPLKSDLVLLAAMASVVLALHALAGNGYGFHRDELQTLDDARHLAAGFVAYPPLTPVAARVAIALFGISPQVFRLPAAIGNALSLVLAGLTARELGGGRLAQAIALMLCLPVAVVFSTMLEYNTFDYLAWAMTALFAARMLRTENGRWWIGVGAALGVGVLSKYSIAFLAVSLAGGVVLLAGERHALRSRWFYLGALTTLVIASPNLIWLVSHHFVTLRMEHAIHTRDVAMGRAAGYFTDQLKFNLLGLPLVILGMVWLVRSRRYRLLAFFFAGPLVLFALAHGRGYYLLPAYIAPNAAAGVALEGWLAARRQRFRASLAALVCAALVADTVAISSLFVQTGTPGSAFFRWQAKNNDDIGEETGWPEFVSAVADAYHGLTPAEQDRLAILAENYGEAGALAVYGPAHGLPEPISPVNSFHARGFGPFEPENVLVTGGDLGDLQKFFESCRVAGQVRMPYGVRNEESRYHPRIFLCHHLRQPWPAVWPKAQRFG